MKRFYALVLILLLAALLPGCFENPIYDDDDSYYDQAPPVDNPPPPGAPNVSGSAVMTSGTFVTNRGGEMTVMVHASNPGGVETAYDIQGQLYVKDGTASIGNAIVYLGDLDAGQWTEASVDVPISAYPGGAATMTLVLTWWDAADNMYQRQVDGYTLFKTPA